MKKVMFMVVLLVFMLSGCSYYDVVTVDSFNATVRADLYGVPPGFTKQSFNEKVYHIQDGALTNMRIRPAIYNEHAESSRELKAIVNDTTMVGQIFRASQDNINGIYLTLESAEKHPFDDFESYSDSSDLQSTWIENYDPAELSTSLHRFGDQSMRLRAQYTGDYWERSFNSTDWTDVTGSFYALFTKEHDYMKFGVYIIDSNGNSKSSIIKQNQIYTWEKHYINVNDMNDDQSTPTNISDIVGIGFYVDKRDRNDYMYVDDMYATNPANDVYLELFDMGNTTPINGTTTINNGSRVYLGDITEQTPLARLRYNLIPGKRMYYIEKFVSGVAREIPTNELLKTGNYYAILISKSESDVNVYGSGFDHDYYKSGYAFTCSNHSSPIYKIGENDDLMFTIFSTQDVYITEAEARADIRPGPKSTFMASVEDSNMTTTNIQLVNAGHPPESGGASFVTRPVFLSKGGKWNLDYNDDPDDNVSYIHFGIRYLYEPQPIWG